MKSRRWLLIIPIIASLAALYGYKLLDRIRTDIKPPQIALGEQLPQLSVADPDTVLLQGITAHDDVDGDVTGSLVVESVSLQDSSGRLLVEYAAFDRSGNVAKAQREAQYTDYEGPRFHLEVPLLYPNGSSFDILSAISATDARDGDIQHRIRATSLVDRSIAELGVHDVRFQVSNSLGDTVSLVIPVEVYEPARYDAELELKEYLVYIKKGTAFDPVSYLSTFTRAGTSVDLSRGLPAGYSLNTTGNVLIQEPGTYPVEFRVTQTLRSGTDQSREQKYTGHSRLIVIVEG